MNKLTKLLSVFVLAGAIGAGVAGVAACKNNDDDSTGPGYEQGDDLVIAANVTGIIVEGVSQETITLSSTKTSHTIDKSAIKVYFATGANADQKGTEVPAANVDLKLTCGGAPVSSWANITADGVYSVVASVKNATMANGATATLGDLKKTINVTISNPAQNGTLAVKAGATLEQAQSSVDSMTSTWTYEVTLANGDKKDVPASEVTVTNLDTTTAADSATATLTWGTITGTVTYKITANATLRTQSYAYNFGLETTAGVYTEDTYIIDNKGDHTGTYVMIPASSSGIARELDKPRTSADEKKFFGTRITFSGGTYKSNGDFDTDTNKKKYIEIKTESAGKITIYWSRNSSADNRGVALWKKDDALAVNIGADSEKSTVVPYDCKGKEGTNEPSALPVGIVSNIGTGSESVPEMATFTVPEAGTYYLTTATKQAAYLYYIQIDNEYPNGAEDNVENVTVTPGDTVLSNLKVTHSTADYKQQFDLGGTFTVDEGYTFTGTGVAVNTAAKTESSLAVSDLEFWLGETQLTPGTTVLNEELITQTGDKTITVKKDGVTATYTINVASALGVDKVTASLKSDVITQVVGADNKIDILWNNFNVTAVGTNENVDVVITAVSYVAKDAAEGTEGTAIAETGTEIGVGDYIVTLTVQVTDKDNSELTKSFTATTTLKITVKPEEGALTEAVITLDSLLPETPADVTYEGASNAAEADYTHSVAAVSGNCVSGIVFKAPNGKKVVIKSKANTSVADTTVNSCFSTQGGSSRDNRSLEMTLAELPEGKTYTVTVYAKSGSGSGTGRYVQVLGAGATTYAQKEKKADDATKDLDCPTSGDPAAFTFENVAAGKLYIGGTAGIDIYYIVITPTTATTNA